MPDHEFLFALQLSDERHFGAMLSDLVGAVLAYVGYERLAIEELRGMIHKALAAGASNGERHCQVRFRAHAGELHIAVEYAGRAEWQTKRALP